MPSSVPKTAQSRVQDVQPEKRPPDISPVLVPLTSFENYEQLDNPRLREVCEYNQDIQQRCIMCENAVDNGVVCKTCKEARYCSWECQVDDQQHHALFCKELFKFREAPGRDLHRILVFPALSRTPVLAWARLTYKRGDDCPRIVLRHPEIWPYAKLIFASAQPFSKIARMGCINECRALAARQSGGRLGHGLFLLEWVPPAGTQTSMDWLNRSIPTITGLPPSQSWFWTGTLTVAAFDLSKTNAKTKRFALEDVNLRDVRHAIDFFTLNLRNPAVPPPSLTAPARSPIPTVPAVRLNEVGTPIAKHLGVREALEEVHATQDVPRDARGFQGLSVICSLLGLAWVVRAALCHGEELDWLYKGYYTHPVPSAASVEARGADEAHLERGVALPWELCMVWTVDPVTGLLEKKMVPRSGDGVVVMHAGGGKLHKEHVQALLEYIEDSRLNRKLGRPNPADYKADFKFFWKAFKSFEKLPADMPSPYDLKPALDKLKEGDKFLVCKEVFRRLIPKLARGMRVRSDGTCIRC